MEKKYIEKRKIDNRQFYMHALSIAVPMILQALITNFVSMLDNIMVGALGTAQMNGVSIANQFVFVFNITMFGAVAGASIFGTQFFGKGDSEGQKYTVRFRVYTAVIVIAIGAAVFYFLGEWLTGLFISSDDNLALAASTLAYGKKYLMIMILGLIPFGFGQAYSSVVRECGETKIPMIGSLAAIGINLLLDYGLIFGKLGMPELGVEGAAIATVVAKTIEALVVIVWAHTHPDRNKYIVGLYRGLRIPGKLTGQIFLKGFPLLINEFLWALGMAMISQCYSVRGLEVVGARNIASTLVNLFGVVYIQLGASIGIIVGAELGAGKHEQAKESAKKLTWFSIAVTSVVAVIIIPISFVFPMIYNTEPVIKELATFNIIVQAIAMPLWSYTNACYFTLRSGGKTGITFLFDFVYTWALMIPLAYILTRYTTMEIHPLTIVVTFSEIVKCIVGYFMVKSGTWINTIVE